MAKHRNSAQNSADKRADNKAKPRFNAEERKKVSGDGKAGNRGRLSSLNDISWYSRYPVLLDTSARIPFPNRPGMSPAVMMRTERHQLHIPGVMALKWIPSIGQSTNVTSPASLAAKELYGKVREAFSGTLDADAPDFVIYMLAMDSMFSYIGACKRVYRMLNAYSAENYATPDALLHAAGLSVASVQNLRAQRADFCFVINQLIKETQKFTLPGVFDVFNRHYWMNDNVYLDAETVNAQFYMFVQEGFYRFQLLDSSGRATGDLPKASGLVLEKTPFLLTNTLTPSVLYDFGEKLIHALAESDDAYTISGYLKRAFQDAPYFAVEELPIEQELTFAYVPEVLSQIENSFCVANAALESGQTSEIDQLMQTNIYQDPATNAVLSKPFVPTSYAAGPGATIGNGSTFDRSYPLSIRNDVPSVQEVVIATRLHSGWANQQTTVEAKQGYAIICATEIALAWYLWSPARTTTQSTTNVVGDWAYVKVASYAGLPSGNSNSVWTGLAPLLMKAQFDWAPIALLDCNNSATVNLPLMVPVGDVHNMAIVPNTVMENIHRVCVLSEFNAFSY